MKDNKLDIIHKYMQSINASLCNMYDAIERLYDRIDCLDEDIKQIKNELYNEVDN